MVDPINLSSPTVLRTLLTYPRPRIRINLRTTANNEYCDLPRTLLGNYLAGRGEGGRAEGKILTINLREVRNRIS